jgi:tRNA(Arg) A34 adenosine deaminase TadA
LRDNGNRRADPPRREEIMDEKFMLMAIEKTREGIARGQTPFGACIVKDGDVVALAHNQVWLTTDITAHAEVAAIRQACRHLEAIDLSGCVIYSTCEPCPMCFSAIHWANIGRIVSGAEIRDAQAAGFNELTVSNEVMKEKGGSRVEIVTGVLRSECQELFRRWLDQAGARTY